MYAMSEIVMFGPVLDRIFVASPVPLWCICSHGLASWRGAPAVLARSRGFGCSMCLCVAP